MGKILVPIIKAKLSNTKLDQQQALLQYTQAFVSKFHRKIFRGTYVQVLQIQAVYYCILTSFTRMHCMPSRAVLIQRYKSLLRLLFPVCCPNVLRNLRAGTVMA